MSNYPPMSLPPFYRLDHIVNNVWIGDWNDSVTPQKLIINNIKAIVTLNSEFIHGYLDEFMYRELGIAHIRIDIQDSRKADITPHLNSILRFISDANRENINVLVHCSAGISRSASVVIAYLIAAFGLDYDRALAHTRAIRPIVRPNSSFEKQLRAFEAALYYQTLPNPVLIDKKL